MLRQVFIYYDNEVIFQYFFAKAFDKEALEIVLKKRLLTYITNPVESKILNKSLLDFQTHFVCKKQFLLDLRYPLSQALYRRSSFFGISQT